MIEARTLLISFTDQMDWGFSGKHGIDLNCCWDLEDNWLTPLIKVFNHTIYFDIYKNANTKGIVEANKLLIKLTQTYRPDYIIYPCNFSGIITTDTLLKLKESGSIIVGFFFDDDVSFEKYSRWMIPFMDYCITHSLNKLDDYIKAGARCLFSPILPISSSIFCKLDHIEKVYSTIFIGGLHSGRKEYIEKINLNGSNVLYLGGGHRNKMEIFQMVESYNKARINLNFSKNNAYGTNTEQIKGRIFEVPLCGSFLLTEYADGLEKYYKIGSEIEAFDSPKEAAEKIRYYIDNPGKREEIALNGHIRAINEYDGIKVLNNIFVRIIDDIKENGRPQPPVSNEKINSLSIYDAEQYFRWVRALLKSRGSLRSEWLETTKLVLETNPKHVEADRLIKRYNKWNDPEPIRHIIQKIKLLLLRIIEKSFHFFKSVIKVLFYVPSLFYRKMRAFYKK
jgi:spore maturation protein CgeB